MKSLFKFSTITGDSVNFSSPDFTKTDSFATSTATQSGLLITYQTIRP